MNRFKKIATMVVSVVMAGTMAFSFAACGEDGKSAYEIAVENGFVGSETEWLASLVGQNGQDGKDGADGQDGKDGADGQNGVGVSSMEINDNGELVIYYSDGTSCNLGVVTGSSGRGIDNVEINKKGELIVTYTDGTSFNLGVVTSNSGSYMDSSIKTMSYSSGTSLNVAVGYNSVNTAITFNTASLPLVNADGTEVNTSITLPDCNTYYKGDLKPLWQTMESALDITIVDKWNSSASDTLADCATNGLSNYDIIGAGNVSTIITQAAAGNLLNLADYLDYMPNFRAFLYENTMAELGTLNDTSTGSIYYTPYYGGMNDVERYNLFRKDYVSQLLDYATDYTINGGTISYAAQAAAKQKNNLGNRKGNEAYDGTKASIESYMGTADSYIVETTNPGSTDGSGTIYVKVDYAAALTAAKDSTTNLYKAIYAAAGNKAYSGNSGNIVDLQNFAINQTSGEVTGDKLLDILRAYIDVAYKWAESETSTTWSQFYNTTVNGVKTTRADLFNSTYACWDVDTYAAIGRCFVTCGNVLGKYQAQNSTNGSYTNYGASTWLLVPRSGYTNRTNRIVSMIGELYGVRGMESSTYLDSSGNYRQTRFNKSTWDALTKFSAFHTEGLVPTFNTDDASNEIGAVNSSCSANSLYDGTATHFQGLSSNDFVHTQTTCYTSEYASSTYVETKDGYNWTCVVTPVSRWLTNDTSTTDTDGNITSTNDTLLDERASADCTVMRFTESALKLKMGGLVVPATVKNDENKLAAVLAFIDYLYSNDGMIENSYGTRSSKDQLSGSAADGYTTTNDGWWYGEKVTSLTINGTVTDISGMTMEDLYKLGVVDTNDNGKQWFMTEEYDNQALVYKNVLYRTGTNSSTNGGVSTYDNGYLYKGKMTPYYTQAVRQLCLNQVVVNGYKSTSVLSSTSLQNLLLGMESFGIVDNASMVQLCNDLSVAGFEIFSTDLGNGTIQNVSQSIGDNLWYTVSPTVDLSGTDLAIVNSYSDFTELFKTSSIVVTYLYLEVAGYGANASLSQWTVNVTGDISTPANVVTYLKTIAPEFENAYNKAWVSKLNYYKNVIAKR